MGWPNPAPRCASEKGATVRTSNARTRHFDIEVVMTPREPGSRCHGRRSAWWWHPDQDLKARSFAGDHLTDRRACFLRWRNLPLHLMTIFEDQNSFGLVLGWW